MRYVEILPRSIIAWKQSRVLAVISLRQASFKQTNYEYPSQIRNFMAVQLDRV